MSRTLSALLFPLPFLLYLAGISYVTTITLPEVPNFGFEWWDKVNHAGAFFLMTLFAYRASGWWFGGTMFRRDAWVAGIFALAYGGLVELIQMGEPERTADVLDWLADGLGAGLAVIAIVLLSRSVLKGVVHCVPDHARRQRAAH
jgi:VanZ family protein